MPTYRRSVVPARAGAAQLPLVAIVGRPNVGKSTLFNRITGSRRSIVGDEPGITRDRIYGEYEWAGRSYRLVDMGGIVPDDPELIATEIFVQAKVALEEADVLVMVVDVRTELARPDYELARLLQRGGKPLFLAVNKVETDALANEAENFRRLGINKVFPVSSEHGQGIGELLDAIAEAIPEKQQVGESAGQQVGESVGQRAGDEAEDAEDEGEKKIRTHGEFEQRETSVAIIGRPNVGKSTLLNALTGTSRAIVSPIAGTTRDAVDEVVEFEGNALRFVDTAGIRRKGKTKLMAEKMSVVMARRHLEAADVALLIIDATEGVTCERRYHRRLCARERAQRDHRGEQVGFGHDGAHGWQAACRSLRFRAAGAQGAQVSRLRAGDFSFGARSHWCGAQRHGARAARGGGRG